MNPTRIIELFIDDEFEESGIEAISLVSRPAHDEQWIAFGHGEEVERLEPNYKIVSDDFCSHNPKLDQLGEPYSQLIEEGWEVIKVEKITPMMVQKMNQERFSEPNEPSFLDNDQFRVRFKYVGFYNIFLWRGSFNCRHTWVRLLYAPTGKIRNSGSSSKGLEDTSAQSSNLQPDTRTEATINSPNPSKQWKPGMPRTGPNLFKKDEMGLEDACWEGYEPIGTKILDGREVPNCVPIKLTEDDFVDSISDYPEGVKNAAKSAVAYAEKNGCWGGEAGLKWAERKLAQLEKERMTFAVADEDKQILVGAAMVPNKMIHRYDDLGNMYYVYFSKASIRKMADKFLKQKRTDETSIEHNGIKLGSDKVYITESWVSEDPIKDKSNMYGFELPSGTWFVQMRVEDKKIWKLVKDNMLTGFSVEGLFANKSVFSKEDKKINQIKQILKSITDE